MNPTDSATPEAFFADLLLPLKQARERRARHFFTLAPDAAIASYWAAPMTRTGGVVHCDLAQADGAGLLEALVAHWLETGEVDLASLQEPLETLRAALTHDAPAPSERTSAVSYSAYPLF